MPNIEYSNFFHSHFCKRIFLSKYTHSFIWIFIQNFDEISRGAAMLRRIRLSVNKCYGTKTEKYFSTFKTILGLFTSENSQCVSTNCCCCCRLDLDNAFQSLNIDTNTYLPFCQLIATLYSDSTEEILETSTDVSVENSFCHFLYFDPLMSSFLAISWFLPLQ